MWVWLKEIADDKDANIQLAKSRNANQGYWLGSTGLDMGRGWKPCLFSALWIKKG